jgi:hypothetical protein
MKSVVFAAGFAVAGLLPLASSQAQQSDFVPPFPKKTSGKCAGAAGLPAPACCLVSINVATDGSSEIAQTRCTDPALEPVIAACQSATTYEPAKRAGEPVPFMITMQMLLAGGGQKATADLCQPLRQPQESR